MEILVISDSHRKLQNAFNAIERYKNNIDLIIHCGDNTDDAENIGQKYNIRVEYIKGNCDFNQCDKEKLICVESRRIFITHGNEYGVKYGYNNLYYRAREVNADIVFFGHTHSAMCEEHNGIYFVNPGSISEPRDGREGSFAIVSISDRGIYPCIVRVK